MRITDLLANNGYILVNKELARELGIKEAILIGELAQEHNYWEDKGMLDDGWFYSTVENIEKSTTLTGRQQRPAIQHLIEAGLVEMKVKGIPRTRYFRLCNDQLLHKVTTSSAEMLPQSLQNVTTSNAEMSQQEVQKCHLNNNKNNNKNINKNKNKNNSHFLNLLINDDEEIEFYD